MKHLAIRSFAAVFLMSLAVGACTDPTGEQGQDESPLGQRFTSSSSEKPSFSMSGSNSMANIISVDPGTPTVTDVITFDTFAAAGSNPGTNFDAVLDAVGADFAERFIGQILTFSGVFDDLLDIPSDPLTLQAGAANQNVGLLTFGGTNTLIGLGPLGFPNANAIGEGSIAVLFDFDQSEVGFTILGAEPTPGAVTINFFKRNPGGFVLETIVVTSGNGPVLFRRVGGARDIAGFSVINIDGGGVAYDDFKFDNTSPNDPPVANAGPDQVVGFEGATEAQVTLDGSGSSDPDGFGDIVSFGWSLNAVPIATGVGPIVTLPVGVHTIVLKVTDNEGASDEDEVIIEVRFVIPPEGGSAPVVNEDGDVVGTVVIPPDFFEVPVVITVVFFEPDDCPDVVSLGEGLCLSITVPEGTVITGFATIGLCFTATSFPPPDFAIFRTDDDGTTVVLQNVFVELDCSGTNGSNLGANPLTRLARGLWRKITGPFRPQVLHATFGDRGAGGLTGFFSDFQNAPQLFVEEAEVDDDEIEISGTFDLSGGPFDPTMENVTITFGDCMAACIKLELLGADFEEDDGEFEFESEDGDLEIEFEIRADGQFELEVEGVDVDGIDLDFVSFMMKIGDRHQGVGLEFNEDGDCISANGSGGCQGDDDDDDDDETPSKGGNLP